MVYGAGRGTAGLGFENPRDLLGDRLREGSLYRLLADHGQLIFPDGYFADLYTDSRGGADGAGPGDGHGDAAAGVRGPVGPGGWDRLEVDLRWQAAAGVDAGYRAFHPTLLVGMRNRLRASARPRRLFEDTKAAAREPRGDEAAGPGAGLDCGL